MEVRRRRAGGTRDDSESSLVDVHPQDPRSQWSISQREQQEGEADSDFTLKIKSSISNALVSLGDNTFINFIINMVRQTIQMFYGSVPPQQLDERTRFYPLPLSNLFLRCLFMSFPLLYPKEPLSKSSRDTHLLPMIPLIENMNHSCSICGRAVFLRTHLTRG